MPPYTAETAFRILTDQSQIVNSFFEKTKKFLLHSQKGCAIIYKLPKNGGLAQLVRASASHAEGRRFESATLHQQKSVFCQATKGAFLHDVFRCAERDVRSVRDVPCRRDVRSAREKEHITSL